MEIARGDGAIERIDCPKQGIIPHDMVHYAVESACPMLDVDPGDIEAIRGCVADLTAQWNALVVGQSLSLRL